MGIDANNLSSAFVQVPNWANTFEQNIVASILYGENHFGGSIWNKLGEIDYEHDRNRFRSWISNEVAVAEDLPSAAVVCFMLDSMNMYAEDSWLPRTISCEAFDRFVPINGRFEEDWGDHAELSPGHLVTGMKEASKRAGRINSAEIADGSDAVLSLIEDGFWWAYAASLIMTTTNDSIAKKYPINLINDSGWGFTLGGKSAFGISEG